MAYDEFNRRRGKRGLIKAIRESKDPSLFAILFEDTAAMLGLFAALIGLFIGDYFGIPQADGFASIVIGIILASTAVVLAFETKSLLIGEAADPAVVKSIEEMFNNHDSVDHVNEILTMHFSPRDVLLNISLDFKNDLPVGQVENIITESERAIKLKYPRIKRIFIEAQSQRGHLKNIQLNS